MQCDVDICYDGPDDLLLCLENISKMGISIKILNAQGPGGGWPNILLKGTKKNIKKALLFIGVDQGDLGVYIK